MTHAIRSHGSRRSEQAGSRPAFGQGIGRGLDRGVTEFFDLHAGALYSLALLFCGDSAVAERIVAEALVDAAGSAAPVQPDGTRTALAADVYGKYAETCRAMDRARGRRPRPSGEGPLTLAGPASPLPPLGWEQRAMLGLVLFGEHSYQQAAALLGVPAESAALQLTTALAALRNAFGSS